MVLRNRQNNSNRQPRRGSSNSGNNNNNSNNQSGSAQQNRPEERPLLVVVDETPENRSEVALQDEAESDRRLEDILNQFLDGTWDLSALSDNSLNNQAANQQQAQNTISSANNPSEPIQLQQPSTPRRASSNTNTTNSGIINTGPSRRSMTSATRNSAHQSRNAGSSTQPHSPLSTQNSGANSNSTRQMLSHRPHVVDNSGLNHLKSLYPERFFKKTQFPTKMDQNQRSCMLHLGEDKLTVYYKTDKNGPNDSGSIRSNYAIKNSCGVYYFEVEIVNKGQQGVIAIGLSGYTSNLKSLPGWEMNSYGYHGDDGNIYIGSGQGSQYGFTYTSGDTIGCCLNFIDNHCFFTKNGVNQGIAFKDISSKLHPTIGMRDAKTQMKVNLGQKAFIFKIVDHVQIVKTNHVYRSNRFISDSGFLEEQTKKLVLAYLIHNGHSECAQMFSSASNQKSDFVNIQVRNKVSNLLLCGKIGQAIKLIESSFSNLLSRSPKLLFLLRVQQFVEKILKNDDEHVQPSEFLYKVSEMSMNMSDNESKAEFQNGETSEANGPSLKLLSNKNDMSLLEDNDSQLGEYGYESMDVSEDSRPPKKSLIFPNIHHIGSPNLHAELPTEDMAESLNPESLSNMKEALVFGHLLYQAGVFLLNENLINQNHYHKMMEVFSLIVVDDIQSSAVSHLISHCRRVCLSENVNSSILQHMGYPGLSNIDSIKNQAEQCYSAMTDLAIPIAGMLDISEFC